MTTSGPSKPSGYRILVAEEDRAYSRIVTRFLTGRGHSVKVFPTGRAALRVLRSGGWEVLLLGLTLPDVRVAQMLTAARRHNPSLQVVVVTAFSNVALALQATRAGALDYLTKPPNFVELAARVEHAGEQARLARENRRLRFGSLAADPKAKPRVAKTRASKPAGRKEVRRSA